MSKLPPSLPTSVRLHPDREISREKFLDETKGWRQFVSEEWVGTEDSLSQRYNLIERWATADQNFRDSYHDRATINPPPASAILSQENLDVNRFVCLVPANQNSHDKNYTHLLKILILLYIVQDGYVYHPFSFQTAGVGPTPQIPTFITPDHENGPDNNQDEESELKTSLSVENLLSALFLRTADFRVMAMTRAGTALFTTEYNSIWYVLDAESLETGLINVVQFKPNGDINCSTRRRPFNLTQIMTFHIGNGWPLKKLIQNGIGGRSHHNQPMDLDLPILDILQTVKDRGEFQYTAWGDREAWAREIERAAPGYLKLESNGREGEFELNGLAELDS